MVDEVFRVSGVKLYVEVRIWLLVCNVPVACNLRCNLLCASTLTRTTLTLLYNTNDLRFYGASWKRISLKVDLHRQSYHLPELYQIRFALIYPPILFFLTITQVSCHSNRPTFPSPSLMRMQLRSRAHPPAQLSPWAAKQTTSPKSPEA